MSNVKVDKVELTIGGKKIEGAITEPINIQIKVDPLPFDIDYYGDMMRKSLEENLSPKNEPNQLDLFPEKPFYLSENVVETLLDLESFKNSLSIFNSQILINSADPDMLDAFSYSVGGYRNVEVKVDDPGPPPTQEVCACGKGKNGFDSHSPWCKKDSK